MYNLKKSLQKIDKMLFESLQNKKLGKSKTLPDHLFSVTSGRHPDSPAQKVKPEPYQENPTTPKKHVRADTQTVLNFKLGMDLKKADDVKKPDVNVGDLKPKLNGEFVHQAIKSQYGKGFKVTTKEYPNENLLLRGLQSSIHKK